jgi:hypothetical protein
MNYATKDRTERLYWKLVAMPITPNNSATFYWLLIRGIPLKIERLIVETENNDKDISKEASD